MGRRVLATGTSVLLLGGMLAACDGAGSTSPDFDGMKVLWVDSYHQGYEWSDGIEAGIRSVLDTTGIELRIVRMDTKRNTDDGFRHTAAALALDEIDAFQPDLVIASDDNAQEYLVVPYLKGTSLPVVFCGVNWDASGYGYPAANVTGMIEVEFPDELVGHLSTFAAGERLAFIAAQSVTEQKVAEAYNDRFFDDQMEVHWFTTVDGFEQAWIDVQHVADILLVGNNAGVDGWDEVEMEAFVRENTVVPTGAVNDWMARYSLITLAKRTEEQGEWAAETALRILSGTSISEIPLAENTEGRMILNLGIADQLGIVFPQSMLDSAEIFGSTGGN